MSSISQHISSFQNIILLSTDIYEINNDIETDNDPETNNNPETSTNPFTTNINLQINYDSSYSDLYL